LQNYPNGFLVVCHVADGNYITDMSESEAGMKPQIGYVDKPFLVRKKTSEEETDHREGFRAGVAGAECDELQTLAWRQGWADAQE
jgi:hypothetical protein